MLLSLVISILGIAIVSFIAPMIIAISYIVSKILRGHPGLIIVMICITEANYCLYYGLWLTSSVTASTLCQFYTYLVSLATFGM